MRCLCEYVSGECASSVTTERGALRPFGMFQDAQTGPLNHPLPDLAWSKGWPLPYETVEEDVPLLKQTLNAVPAHFKTRPLSWS